MGDWKQKLAGQFNELAQKTQSEAAGKETQTKKAEQFIASTAVPALEELKTELEKYGRTVVVRTGANDASITVTYQGTEEIHYAVRVGVHPNHVTAHPEYWLWENGKRYKGVGYFRSGAQYYHASTVTKEEIIENFLQHYRPKTR